MHPRIQQLLQAIDLEEKEQAQRFRLDQQHNLKSLKAEGLALHPLIVTRKTFGYADYPEISFRLNFPPEASLFRDGAAIECFIAGAEPIRGILVSFEGNKGEFRLFAPDFPDWIEDDGIGIKLAPDTRTSTIMKKVMNGLENNKPLLKLFERLHQHKITTPKDATAFHHHDPSLLKWQNNALNASQQTAVKAILQNEQITIVHGPPGTGKTTTLVEAILHLVGEGKRVLLSAPGNAAVDHISKSLIQKQVRLLRVGNTGKVDEQVFPFTPEGKLSNTRQHREIKELKKKADEFRRMAHRYKRNYGKAEREQRNLLLKEVRSIRDEIRQLEAYNEEKLFNDATVIAGTPIGLYDAGLEKMEFDTLVIDEAGQCIEPLAWCIVPLAHRIVLAGDHWQLPPTVLSNEAALSGLNRSILEIAVDSVPELYLLDTQYRMREVIAGFSSRYFYNNMLRTAEHLHNKGTHLTFIDTAGSGYHEAHGPDGISLQNPGELDIVLQVLEKELGVDARVAFISPYSGQVSAARDLLPKNMRVNTIDSFQGQEHDSVIVSLVRSNDDGEIGFLKDYRRMNVAITRAKDQLIVVGDSATIGGDPFYGSFLDYVEQHGNYRTVWEFEMH